MTTAAAPPLILGAGFTAGRIKPTNYTPADGDYAVCFGSDLPGVYEDIEDGDLVGVEQTIDLTSVDTIVFSVAMRQSKAESAAVARAYGVYYPPANLAGKTLLLKVDGGTEQTVTFESADNTPALVAARISSQITGATCVADNGHPKITSNTVGSSSSVQITGGTGRTLIGFQLATYTGQSLTFAFKVIVGGSTLYTLQPAEGSSVVYNRRAVNVSGLTGSQAVRFILEAV